MKDLVIHKRVNLGFTPEIVGYLANIKESDCSYKDLNVRHPSGVFNSASHPVVEDFIGLLKELESHQLNYSELVKPTPLEKIFRDSINDFFKFHDSCYEVIVGCCKNHDPPHDDFLSKWLNVNNYTAGENFHNQLWNNDLDYLNKIHNKLKHTSSQIRSINFNHNKTAIIGFFIQGSEDGIPGPDKDLHPKYNGTYTGTSYNFILRSLYYNLYKICYVLEKVVIQHFKDVYNSDLKFNDEYKNTNKDWNELYERMNKLPKAYFPNEFGKKIYEFRDNNSKLIFVKRHAKSIDLDDYRISMLTTGDGYSRSFRMPYMIKTG